MNRKEFWVLDHPGCIQDWDEYWEDSEEYSQKRESARGRMCDVWKIPVNDRYTKGIYMHRAVVAYASYICT